MDGRRRNKKEVGNTFIHFIKHSDLDEIDSRVVDVGVGLHVEELPAITRDLVEDAWVLGGG